MPPLQNCCCCCELKTGVIIIAVLGWISTLIQVFALVPAAHQNYSTSSTISYNYNNKYQLNSVQDSSGSGILAVQIIFSLISLTCCILLIVGVAKNSRYYLLPWMIINFIGNVIFSLGIIVGIILFSKFQVVPVAQALLIFLFLLLASICILCWYLWVVVYSYYVQLREEQPTVQRSNAISPNNSYPFVDKEEQSLA